MFFHYPILWIVRLVGQIWAGSAIKGVKSKYKLPLVLRLSDRNGPNAEYRTGWTYQFSYNKVEGGTCCSRHIK